MIGETGTEGIVTLLLRLWPSLLRKPIFFGGVGEAGMVEVRFASAGLGGMGIVEALLDSIRVGIVRSLRYRSLWC